MENGTSVQSNISDLFLPSTTNVLAFLVESRLVNSTIRSLSGDNPDSIPGKHVSKWVGNTERTSDAVAPSRTNKHTNESEYRNVFHFILEFGVRLLNT